MYQYPQRKRYKYIIPTIKGDCVLQLQQATASETNEYIDILKLVYSDDRDDKIRGIELKNQYINTLITTAYPVKWYEFKKKQILSLVIENIGDYISDILDMVHVFRESIYKETKSPKINGKQGRANRFDGLHEIIYWMTGIPSDEIDERLTIEQIGWYMDKSIYRNYEQFKEWMIVNDVVFNKKGMWLTREQQEDLETIKKHLHSKSK